MITSMHFALWNSHFGSPTHSNCPSALVFSISRSPAQHNVFRCGNKPQFLSPLSYLSHLHVPGLSDISDVKRNLSELSVTSSVDSGFKGSGHSFRLRDRSPVRCKWNHWPCTSTARDVIHSSRDSTWYWFSIKNYYKQDLRTFHTNVFLEKLHLQPVSRSVTVLFFSHWLCKMSCKMNWFYLFLKSWTWILPLHVMAQFPDIN